MRQVIAFQEPSRFLVAESQTEARIVDMREGYVGPLGLIDTIISRGYWEDVPEGVDTTEAIAVVGKADYATLFKFNPDQPRDDHGRWTDGEGQFAEPDEQMLNRALNKWSWTAWRTIRRSANNGFTGDLSNEARAIAAAVAKGRNSPEVWRGMWFDLYDPALQKFSNLKAGSTLDLNLSSWTANEDMAREFAGKSGRPVMLYSYMVKGIDVESRVGVDEGEWITSGRFQVESVSDYEIDGVGGVMVELKQIGTFDSPGDYAAAKSHAIRLSYADADFGWADEAVGRAMEQERSARPASVVKYNPDQPRVPAGEPGGGQWTSDGGGTDWREHLEVGGKAGFNRYFVGEAWDYAHPNTKLKMWSNPANPDVAIRSLDQLSRLLRDFPVIPVKSIEFMSDPLMGMEGGTGILGMTRNQDIRIDTAALGNLNSERSDERMWYPPGTANPEGIATHEFAHALDHYIAQYGIDVASVSRDLRWGYAVASDKQSEQFACDFQAAYAPGSKMKDDPDIVRFRQSLDEVLRYVFTDEDIPAVEKRARLRRKSGGVRRERTLNPIRRRLRERLIEVAREYANITKASPTKKGRFTKAAVDALMAAYNEAWAAGFSDAWADAEVLDADMLATLGVSPEFIDEEGLLDEDALGEAGISVSELTTALEDGRNTIAGAAAEQTDYLKNLAAALLAGITAAALAQRMGLYAASVAPVYERGFANSMALQGEIVRVEWSAEGDKDTCELCQERDGTVWYGDQEHPYPGDGRFGGPVCEGGTNCRCALLYSVVTVEEAMSEGYLPGAEVDTTDMADDGED